MNQIKALFTTTSQVQLGGFFFTRQNKNKSIKLYHLGNINDTALSSQ
jgi:hypothetical protein